jgi:hypothetical protein
MAQALCNELVGAFPRGVGGVNAKLLTRSTAMAGRVQALISSFTVPSSGPARRKTTT